MFIDSHPQLHSLQGIRPASYGRQPNTNTVDTADIALKEISP